MSSGSSRKPKNPPLLTRRVAMVWSLRLLLAAVLAAGLFISAVAVGIFGPMPSKKDLRAIHHDNASLIFDRQGELIGKYYDLNRNSIVLDSLPPFVSEALISIEDARYFEHAGIDWQSMGRVLIKTVLIGDESAGGGSTIPQQLAKNLYGRRNYRLGSIAINKTREIITAIKLEQIYEKDEILELYLNTVPFGENVFGIESASWRFFSKPAAEMKQEEAATLVGLLKANTYYNPRLHPERSLARRNLVLSQMQGAGFISALELDSLKATELRLDYQKRGPHDGLAPYFRAYVKREAESILAQAHPEQQYNLDRDGLRVYTTVHSRLQEHAEAAVQTELSQLQKRFAEDRGSRLSSKELDREIKRSPRYQKMLSRGLDEQSIMEEFEKTRPMNLFSWEGDEQIELSPKDSILYQAALLQIGLLSVDAQNGEILAWVGGIEERRYPYDHVMARRQVGSTFKPILFASALENGEDPCSYLSAAQVPLKEYDDWAPRNSNGSYDGYWSMQAALAKSINTAAVDLYLKTDYEALAETAKAMGISSDLPDYPSLALGTASMNVFELTQAYQAFPSLGRVHDLHTVKLILDRDGQLLYDARSETPGRTVLSPRSAGLLVRMMQSTVDSGTAIALRSRFGLQGELAGKTGTTQDGADAWFTGFSPRLLSTVWVGADNPSLHFSNSYWGQGSRSALPVWGRYMRFVQRDASLKAFHQKDFQMQDPALDELLDCASWVAEIPQPNFWERLFGTFGGNQRFEYWQDESVSPQAESKREKRRKRRKNRKKELL